MRAIVLLFVAVLGSGIGRTCCVAYGEEQVLLSGERAIIIWDAENGLEHFVRQASFTGEAKDFGFIVPAPSKPEVAEAEDKAFQLLEALVPREPSRSAKGVGSAADESIPPTAALIEQYTVGDYEVSILKAQNGEAMIDWLKANDYTNRPAMEPWLDYYAQMGWYFAALKFIRQPESTKPETQALRVSFKTNEPFYPYKMPGDTWPDGHFRPMSLYFVAAGVARASYRGTNTDWEADIRWSGALPRRAAKELADAVDLKVTDIPAEATVTVFRNSTNAQGYDRDLKFDTYQTLIPTWALGVILVGAIAGFVYVFRTRKPATAPSDTPDQT